MKNFNMIARGAILSGAMLMMVTTPAFAEGKADRARQAIAEASAKVDIANKLGAGGDVTRLQAEAQAALSTAKADLGAGHKEDSIAAAIHASKLADEAIGYSQQHQADAQSNTAAQADAAAAAAVDANARAASAEQAAASAQADAAAARAAPPVVVAQAPVPQTTTVTTETVKGSTSTGTVAKKKVVAVKRPASTASRATEKTTTTVTTTPAG